MPKLTPDEHLRRLLDTGEAASIQHLRQELQLSDRQLRRVVQQLRSQGVAVQERREAGRKLFYLPDDRQQVALPELRFDAAELRALAIAAKASRAVLIGTPHTLALTRAFDKLLEHAQPVTYIFDLKDSMQEWYFDDNPADRITLGHFVALERAMDEHCSVRIDYLTAKSGQASTGRKVDPYCFAKRGRAWLLVAYCHQKRDLRNFSLTRISRVEPCLDEYYIIPNDFDPERYFSASLGSINTGECYGLRLLVEPDKSLYFRERLYHPTQQIEEEHADGRVVVSYELEGFEEMRSFCQGWGVGVTVLEPADLRDRLRAEAETLLGRYQG